MVIGLRGETHADQKLALRDDSLGLSAPRPGVRSRAGAPAKMRYDAALYITLQKTLYVAWGPPNVGGILEPAAILATISLAFILRKRKRAFSYTLGAGIALLLAFPVVFFWLVVPANEVFLAAPPGSIPANWMEMRRSWENGHAIRFVLQLAALSLLVLSVVLETRDT